jgi:hypothetical protein
VRRPGRPPSPAFQEAAAPGATPAGRPAALAGWHSQPASSGRDAARPQLPARSRAPLAPVWTPRARRPRSARNAAPSLPPASARLAFGRSPGGWRPGGPWDEQRGDYTSKPAAHGRGALRPGASPEAKGSLAQRGAAQRGRARGDGPGANPAPPGTARVHGRMRAGVVGPGSEQRTGETTGWRQTMQHGEQSIAARGTREGSGRGARDVAGCLRVALSSWTGRAHGADGEQRGRIGRGGKKPGGGGGRCFYSGGPPPCSGGRWGRLAQAAPKEGLRN